MLTRLSSHVSVLFLALAAIVASGVNLSSAARELRQPAAIADSGLASTQANLNQSASNEATVQLRPALKNRDDTLVRYASPLTQIPDRPRAAIISYTVRPGDTLFGIALQFNLNAPETILWANPDLKDNPDLLDVGMTVIVPPVDGVIHVVQEGDTLQSIAEKYKASVSAIVNAEWNSLKQGQSPIVGQHLIVPGGKRELVVWRLPVQPSTETAAAFAKAHIGFCQGVIPAALGSGTFIWPTDVHRLGGNPYTSWHRAIDIPQNSGNPVYASDSGTVVYAGWNSWGYGNLVVLDHGNGWQTWYAHLSQIYIRCGQQLFQGAVIGAVGSTGRSTGPHLHFETRYNGDLPNPLNVLP